MVHGGPGDTVIIRNGTSDWLDLDFQMKDRRIVNARSFRPEDFDVVERLVEVAKEKGLKPAQVALAWLLSKQGVASPIIGPTRVEQLEELVQAVDVRLRSGEIKRLEEPYVPHPILGHQ